MVPRNEPAVSRRGPAVITGALLAVYVTAAWRTGESWLTAVAGVALIAAGVAHAVTRMPRDGRDDGLEALMNATREDRLPQEWTAADWAELDELTATEGLDQ